MSIAKEKYYRPSQRRNLRTVVFLLSKYLYVIVVIRKYQRSITDAYLCSERIYFGR